MLMCMSVLKIFCVRGVSGTVSKALLMSMAARRVRWAGLGAFRPSSMDWVRVVSRVVVE